MSADDRDTLDLLAAYADGGLSHEERKSVERLLEHDVAARREVETMRRVITATRAAQPRPSAEPAWDQMASEIRAACDAEAPPKRSRVRSWWQTLLRPQVAAPLVAVAAAVVLFVVWSRSPGSVPASGALGDQAVALAPDTDDGEGDYSLLRAAEVEDLNVEELDVLLAALGPGAMVPDPDLDDDLTTDLTTDDDLVPDDVIADWVLADAAAPNSTDHLDEGDLFGVPDYGTLLDELSEAEIDEIDAFLAAQTG